MASDFDNIKRILTMLEKALKRLTRQYYYTPKQYPEIILEIMATINKIRAWIENHQFFEYLNAFYAAMGLFFQELGALISQLWEICRPKPGKKRIPKKRRINEQKQIFKSLNTMLNHLMGLVDIKEADDPIVMAFEQGMENSFIQKIVKNFKKKLKILSLKGASKHTSSHGMI